MSPRNKSKTRPKNAIVEHAAVRATRWIGSTASLIFHTVVFAGAFLLVLFGLDFNTVFLVLTTIVSLEAIYLSIFIQMSVNRQDQQLREVSEDVDEIAEDIDEIQEDVDEIQHDIDEIQEDVDEIQEDVEEIQEEESEETSKKEIPLLDPVILDRIESSLRELGKEIAEMRRKPTDE